MIFENAKELVERIEFLTARKVYGRVPVLEDTSDYMGISQGTVLRLADRDYYIRGEAKEGRFGIGEQPKLWVKYAFDLTDGSRKILKLVFHEHFTTHVGALAVRCVRDADKESRVLELTAGDDRFMQGHSVRDQVGNNVRILDYIRGTSLFNYVALLKQDHEEYFHTILPGVLRKILGCIEAIGMLHDHGEQHGDIRNDHILIEHDTEQYRWIDFDYRVNFTDYDLFGMGNILTYAVGKGIQTCREYGADAGGRGEGEAKVQAEDALLFYSYRLANLRKLFPYIPPELNEMLMRFSAEATNFYEDFAEMAADLRAILEDVTPD
jgi:hypothetical protein